NAELDAAGKRAEDPVVDFEKASREAAKQIAAMNAEYAAFLKTVEDGKPGDAEKQRIEERLRIAKLESAGDDEAFERRKIEIVQEEELAAKEKLRADLNQADAV